MRKQGHKHTVAYREQARERIICDLGYNPGFTEEQVDFMGRILELQNDRSFVDRIETKYKLESSPFLYCRLNVVLDSRIPRFHDGLLERKIRSSLEDVGIAPSLLTLANWFRPGYKIGLRDHLGLDVYFSLGIRKPLT